MTSVILLAAALICILLIAFPAVASLSLGRSGLPATAFYVVLAGALFAYHVGYSAGARLPPASLAGQTPAGLCRQLLDQTRQFGMIEGPDAEGNVRARSEMWRELPEQGREAIRDCLDQSRPSGQRDRPIRIVEYGG